MKRNFFLDHPVFSTVLSIVIVIVGTIGLTLLLSLIHISEPTRRSV